MIGGVLYDGRNFTADGDATALTSAMAHARRAEELLRSIHGGIYPNGTTVAGQVAQVHATLALVFMGMATG